MAKPISPQHSQRSGPAQPELERAALALQMQQPAEAARLAETVLKSNRGHVGAAILLGHALLAQNRVDDAVTHLDRAARRVHDVSIETLLASALTAAGRPDEALDVLQRITSQSTGHPPAFREHIGRLAALGRLDQAIAVAVRGVELSPEAIELRLDLASLYLRRNQRAAARATLVAAAEFAAGRSDVLAELARTFMLDGEYESAAETYRRALALNPDNAMTRANYSVCLFEMGDRDAGDRTLRQAMRGGPQMLGRAIHSLAASSHGRFFLKPSAAARYLAGSGA